KSKHAAQGLELPIAGAGDENMAVRGLEFAIGHDVRMRVAETAGDLAADEIVGPLVDQHRDLAVEQRAIDMLPLPRGVAVMQRGEDGDGGVEASKQVADRQADFDWPGPGLAIWPPGDAHQPAHPLDEEVVAAALRVGSAMAEAGDGTIDQARVDRRQRGIVEPVAVERPGFEILDHDVGRRGHALDDLGPLGLGEIDGDAALVAVGAQIIGRVRDAVRALNKRRPPGAGVVAGAWPLDLPYLGAEIAENLRRPGTGENARQVENLQSAQRPGA